MAWPRQGRDLADMRPSGGSIFSSYYVAVPQSCLRARDSCEGTLQENWLDARLASV
jgi:hypothetical protein